MKLLFCVYCQDIIRLRREARKCSCGRVAGRYLTDVLAVYSDVREAIPLGIANESLAAALYLWWMDKREGNLDINAFVIPQPCDTFKPVKNVEEGI